MTWQRSNQKVPLDLHQRHRDTEAWAWKRSGQPVEYRVRKVQSGTDPERVALLLCLSGSGPRGDLRSEIDASVSIYELTLHKAIPNPTFLRLREDLETLESLTNRFLAEISKMHGTVKEIDLL